MFFNKLIICYFSCFGFLLSNIQNESMDVCLIPFSEKRCEIKSEDEFMQCDVDLSSTYRQFKCFRHQNRRLMLSLSNFALFYPPYSEILFDTIKDGDRRYRFDIFDQELALELDMNSFVNLFQAGQFGILLYYRYGIKKLDLIINSPSNNQITLDFLNGNTFLVTFTISSKTNETTSELLVPEQMSCYSFLLDLQDSETVVDEKYINCPSNKCLTGSNETRLCLGSIPCLDLKANTLLCRIDKLRSSDRFNLNVTFLYANLIITTSDTHKQTLHTFSAHLLDSCIARRLTIIIIYGRLEIPPLNATSFSCSDGSITEVEFWHGHCSTFEVLSNRDLERMYETNLITLGNFYTGRIDKLRITCAVHFSAKNTHGRSKLSTLFWIILSITTTMMMILCMCVLWYCKKSFRHYVTQIWRNITANRRITPNLNSTSSDLSGTLHKRKG